MYRSILVPLDGSTLAEHALPLALGIARQADATLNLVQVHVPFALMDADSLSPGTYAAEAKVKEQERAYLNGMLERLTSDSPVPVTSALLEGPVIAEMLNAHAITTKADLVVMTTHGRGPLSRFWLGSVADEMVRRATTPILVVQPQEKPADFQAESRLRHILIPLDGSALAEQALEPAIALGSLMQADFTLLRVYGPEIDFNFVQYSALSGFDSATQGLREKAQDYLTQVAARLKEQGIKVQMHVVLGQSPANTVLASAQRLGMDFIALETHGRRGLTRLLLGSVADKIVRGASIPVLVHRSSSG